MLRTSGDLPVDDIDIAALWRAIGRDKFRLFGAVLIAGLATYGVLSAMAPRYKSTAEVLIEKDESSYTRPKGDEVRAGEAQRIDADIVASQVQVIVSRDLLTRVAKDMRLERRPEFNSAVSRSSLLSRFAGLVGLGASDLAMPEDERILAALERQLLVYPLAKTHVVAIEVETTDAALAAETANAVASAYLEANQRGGLQQDTEASTFIGNRIDALRQDTEKAEADFEKFRAKSGLLAGQNNVTLNTQQLSEISTQLSQAKAQRGDAVARAKLIREMLVAGDVDASPEVLKSPLMQRLLESKINKERQVAELSTTLLPGHPRMRQLNSELATLRAQVRNEGLKVVRSLDNEAKIAGAREASLSASIKELSSNSERSSDDQAKLSLLERDAKSKRELYQTYLDRFNDARVRGVELAQPTIARLISSARASSVPSFPRKGPLSALAMTATLLAGLAFLVTRELIRGSGRAPAPSAPVVRGPVAVGVGRGYAVPAGLAAAAAAAPTASAVVVPKIKSPAHFDTLAGCARYIGLRAENTPGYRTLVTGADASLDAAEEALELARQIAHAGRRVIVVEWDGSGVAEATGIDHGPGVHDLIAGTVGFEDVIAADSGSPVQIMRSGTGFEGSVLSTARDQVNLVLDALDEIYQHVILTAPRRSATELFEAIEGRVDAGLSVLPGPLGATGTVEEGFLGYVVPELEVITFEPAAKPAQKSPRREPAATVAVAAQA